uniref:Thioredoxin domain-containing protein n=1 Tax=Rhabditophanes sp. KR3021 TaxID=114890 RepID=A0AC35TQZ0_9BILA
MNILRICLFFAGVAFLSATVIPLTDDNIEKTLQDYDIVLINFSAEWCRFSQMLKPIFAEASEKIADDLKSRIAFASVDADKYTAIAQKYHINKYPTLKLVKFGELVKKEYRGQRSADSLAEYVTKILNSAFVQVHSEEDLAAKLDKKKSSIIAYSTGVSKPFEEAVKSAGAFSEDCNLYLGTGEWVEKHTTSGHLFEFYNAREGTRQPFQGDFNNIPQLKEWISSNCVPIIREITFENAEEMTEEGLPFLILFRTVGDTASEKKFSDTVMREIQDQKKSVNCLMADGKQFAHPLHHLGKSEKDLPLVVIDSFRHMYLFKDFKNLDVQGSLRQFVLDLHSGRLHREFHHGPDPNAPPGINADTTAPPSVFEKLKPSDARYTMLNKDELQLRIEQLIEYEEREKTVPLPPPRNPRLQFTSVILLMYSIERNDIQEVERLLKLKNVDINLQNDYGKTALHECCITNKIEFLALLIYYGADVNIGDNDLWTPLHSAAFFGHNDVARILIDESVE